MPTNSYPPAISHYHALSHHPSPNIFQCASLLIIRYILDWQPPDTSWRGLEISSVACSIIPLKVDYFGEIRMLPKLLFVVSCLELFRICLYFLRLSLALVYLCIFDNHVPLLSFLSRSRASWGRCTLKLPALINFVHLTSHTLSPNAIWLLIWSRYWSLVFL